MEDKKILMERLDEIRKKIDYLIDNFNFDDGDLAKTERLIDELQSERKKILDSLETIDWNFIIGDDQVDLYKIGTDTVGKYIICLHDTKIQIGDISYTPGKHLYFGNIGYSIYEKYRGNNYAFHAVGLLMNFLYLNGVQEATIKAYMINAASIRVMEKLKGLDLDCEINKEIDRDVIEYCYKFDHEISLHSHKK